ncbi:hypothetical protein [Nocardioides flavescens]|uniref:hypothetical protein n=1 Tax=Nocardioides flavescens TaxID=2691959 RepID=UPI00136F4BD2|nr:hypothetical protein [Nocardioides flavescens]
MPAETNTVRSSDLIAALADTRATGHLEFLRQGLHMWTDGSTNTGPNGNGGTWNTDKVAEYFPVTGPLPAKSRLTWNGTSPQPGVQLVFDADGITGNGNDYNVLVGEPAYTLDADGYYVDWWLSNASSATARQAAPSCDGSQAVADADTPAERDALLNDKKCTGGSGSPFHGGLAQWAAKLPAARMLAGGFSLGSGVKGDGILTSIEFGSSVYGFTNIPPATAPAQGTGTTPTTSTAAPVVKDVTGTFSSRKSKVRVKVKFSADALAAGTTQGKKIQWKVRIDRTTALKLTQGAGDTDVFKTPRLKGKHVVQIFKDGVLVKTIKFRSKA